jgi:hypothetical protein
MLVLFLFLFPLAGGFTDDGFIHIQYARNLSTYGEYSFNRGEVSFGTTSPLWVMVLAAIGSLSNAQGALITASGVLSWIAAFASLVAVYALALALGASRFTACVAALALAADVWFARWAALGMETSSSVLAILLMAIASARALESRRSAAMFGAFAALSALLRPEVYLALPVFAVAAISAPRGSRRRTVVTGLVVAALLLAPWVLYAKLCIGSFLPNTAGAKSGGLVTNPVVFARKLLPVAMVVVSSQGTALVLLMASLFSARGRSLVVSTPARFLVLWVVALPVAYVVLDMQILSRYLLLVTPVLCVLGWVSFERVLGARRSRPVLAACVTAAIAGSSVFYARVVVPPSRAFTHDLTHNLRGIAEYLAENAGEDAVVAAADIGYLAFYSGRRVLDLGGLVEPEMAALHADHAYEEIVDHGLYFGLLGYPHVDFMIDRVLEPSRLSGATIAGRRFDEVYATTVRNLGIRKPGPYYYTLYRLTPVVP